MPGKKHTNFYVFGQILAGLAGILTIVLIILTFIGGILVFGGGAIWNWLLSGGFGLVGNIWWILAIICGILLLIIAIGSAFKSINGIITGIIVLLLAIFQPGFSCILALIAAVMFIIDGIA